MLLKAGMKLPDGTILQYTKKGFGPESTVGRLEISDGGTRWFIAPNNGAWRIRPTSQHDWDRYELGSEGDYTLAKMHENKNKTALDLLKEYRSIVEDDDSKNCTLCGERVSDPYKHRCDLNAGSTKRATEAAKKKKVSESTNTRPDLDRFMAKCGFVKINDPRETHSVTYKSSVLHLTVMIDHDDDFWTIEAHQNDQVLGDGRGEDSLKAEISSMIRDVRGIKENTEDNEQHGKFNTCSECDGKGCPECEFTGKYNVGVNSEHYL